MLILHSTDVEKSFGKIEVITTINGRSVLITKELETLFFSEVYHASVVMEKSDRHLKFIEDLKSNFSMQRTNF